MPQDVLPDLNLDQPPVTLSPAKAALWLLAKGGYRVGPEWERAHAFGQANEGSREHDLVHAVAHLIEGDLRNADYWYARANDTAESRDPQRELQRIWTLLD